MRVLITGHMGFVGRHFEAALAGHRIVSMDIKSQSGWMDCRNFFRNNDSHFDLVIHCAAVVGGRAMIERSPMQLAAEDLTIDGEMWRWALRTRPERIVYFSSSAAYPTHLQAAPGHRLTEDDIDLNHVANPDETYGWVKLTGELMAQHAEREGLRVHIFRPFSGYGEDQDLTYPWPSFAQRAAVRANPFEIWGDGTQVRDWIHIDDIVGAVMAAIVNDVPGPTNLCSGIATQFNDLAPLMMKAAGYSAPIMHLPDQPKGVLYRVGDPHKMLSFYTPRVSLEEGIARAIKAVR